MKKFFCIALACIILSGLFSVFPASAAQTPEGTAISSAEDLANMETDGKYYLSRDITIMSAYTSGTFRGTLDGNGHRIILMGSGVTSVFSSISGTVKNLSVVGNISISSAQNVGSLALNASGKLENVISEVNITYNGSGAFSGYIGGLVAVIDGNIELVNCKNNGKIQINTTTACAQRSVHVGGLVGYANGNYTISFVGCANNGELHSSQPNINVGGLMGWSQGSDVTFERCANEGALHSMANNYTGIGGMIGGMYNKGQQSRALVAKECINRGSISGGGDMAAVNPMCTNLYAGGIIGQVYSVGRIDLSDCVNEGSINLRTGQSGSAVGGMAGMFITVSSAWSWAGFDAASYRIVNCVNRGELTGLDVGGMTGAATQLGFNDDEISLYIESCVNTGDVWGARYASGIAGRWANSEGNGWSSGTAEVTISKCMNTGVVEGVTSAAGIFVYMESEGILSERASATKLGDKIGDSPKITLVESCINTGEIIANSGRDNENKEIVAAGIVAHTNRNITIKNCVNIGKLDMPANDDPCLVQIISTTKNVTASGNVCLDTIKGVSDNATAVSEDALLGAMGEEILAYEAPKLLEKYASAKELDAEKYESASYNALMSVCESIESVFGKDTDITRVTQKKVAVLSEAFDECYAALVKISDSENSQDIPSAPEGGNTENGGVEPEATKPDDEDVLLEPEASDTESTEPKSEGGCGSVVGGSAIALIALAALSLGASRKKE